MKLSLLSFSFVVLSTNCFAIKCDFRFSEDDFNYPEHIIDSLVERSIGIETTIKKSENFDCDDGFNDTGKPIKEFVISRFDDSPVGIEQPPQDDVEEVEAESICGSTKKTIRPKVLPSIEDSKLVTVINHGPYTQTVTIELCTNANKPCAFNQNFPLGYFTKCKQKHQTHTVKALNADKTAIVDQNIYFPSGCDCRIYQMKNHPTRK